MSGYVPKKVSMTRTAMGTTDQRPAGSGSAMLNLVSSVNKTREGWRATKRRGYVSMVQKECKQGVLSQTDCDAIASSLRLFN